MSGPKISIYSLSPAYQKLFFDQIEYESKAASCAKNISVLIERLEVFCRDFDKQMGLIDIMNRRAIEGFKDKERLVQIKNMISSNLEGFRKTLKKNTPVIPLKRSVFDLTEGVLNKRKKEFHELSKLLEQLQPIDDELNEISDPSVSEERVKASILQAFDFHSEDDNSGASERLSDRGESKAEIQTSIMQDLAGFYSFDVEDIDEDTLDSKKQQIITELRKLLNDNTVGYVAKQGIKEAIDAIQRIASEDYLNTYKKITVSNLLRRIDDQKAQEAKDRAAFQQEYYRYQHLCNLLGISEEVFQYSSRDVERLNHEIAKLEKLVFDEQEQAYVNDCVDQVMEEMGYDLIGSREVTKRNGKRFKNELYTFNEGTAVNVTYSSDGRIAMELGGIAREDRIPTEDETRVLTEDMQTFCSEFDEFERRLRAKGVVVGNRIALSPPTAEYAAIININDYDIPESMQVSEIRVTEKKSKAVAKKQMRSEC